MVEESPVHVLLGGEVPGGQLLALPGAALSQPRLGSSTQSTTKLTRPA